jgi:carnitine O-acetyltransferase
MAIQLAQYKYTGKVVATYESAQTRAYEYGRTETCRSVSVESKAYVEKMVDVNVSNTEKGVAARLAIAAHGKYMGLCVKGAGVDRHLMGLKKLLGPGENVPSIYTDKMYTRSQHWTLSTSQITSEYYDGYGWAEVFPGLLIFV